MAPEATALMTVVKRINIFAKNQPLAPEEEASQESRSLVEVGEPRVCLWHGRNSKQEDQHQLTEV